MFNLNTLYRQESLQVQNTCLESCIPYGQSWLDLLWGKCLLVPCVLLLWEIFLTSLLYVQIPTKVRALDLTWLVLDGYFSHLYVNWLWVQIMLLHELSWFYLLSFIWSKRFVELQWNDSVRQLIILWEMKLKSIFRLCEDWSLYNFGDPL